MPISLPASTMPKFDLSPIFKVLIDPIVTILFNLTCGAFAILLLFSIYVIIKLRINPFKRGYRKVILLKKMYIGFKLLDFIRWVYVDMICFDTRRNRFTPYGMTMYCGRQGGGKTISMVEYANRIHMRYPECIIVANFSYKYANRIMKDWRDFFEIRNGRKGVLFLLDEIHSEYSSADWKDFPESLLSEISQQRKQGIKICATAQVYSRVAKPLREQTYSVVQCLTFLSRWTFNREYDARDYEIFCDNADKKKLKAKSKTSFVQDDALRMCYNTYKKIKRMKRSAFIPRNERGT